MKKLFNKSNVMSLLVVAAVGFGDSPEKNAANVYNPIGKRDPFKVLNVAPAGRKISAIFPTEKYDLDQLNLKAILRIGGRSRAMIEAPDGQSFIIYEGETVGRERATLSRILKTEIIFTQQTFNYLGNASLVERVLSLPPESPGLIADSVEEGSHKKRGLSSGNKNSKNSNQSAGSITENAGAAGDTLSNPGLEGVSAQVQRIMNRPNQLEKELDEVMGVPQK